MSSYPVTRNFGKSPSDIIGQLKLKGGVAQQVAEGLLRFEVAVVEERGRRVLAEVSLIATPSSPSVGRRWEKANEGDAKREDRFRRFLDRAKAICRDELEEDGSNALDVIISKLELFEMSSGEELRAFFREARELVKDEVGEGDNVFPVILNKLRLLAEWRRLKEEGETS